MQPETTADPIRKLDNFEKEHGIGTYMVYHLKHGMIEGLSSTADVTSSGGHLELEIVKDVCKWH